MNREKGERIMMVLKITVLVLLVLAMGSSAWAAEDETELAKKTQNPVADLISIPLQNNMNGGIGPNNRTQNVLNVQPVLFILSVSFIWFVLFV